VHITNKVQYIRYLSGGVMPIEKKGGKKKQHFDLQFWYRSCILQQDYNGI
jgi:hypothetical protein